LSGNSHLREIVFDQAFHGKAGSRPMVRIYIAW
jgi:hypothetical protein